MATRAEVVQLGFDPSFIQKLIADWNVAEPEVLQLLADYQKSGLGIAVIVDLFTLFGTAGPAFFRDILGLFTTPQPVVMTAGAHPFIDWLLANGPNLLAFFLKILPLLDPKQGTNPYA